MFEKEIRIAEKLGFRKLNHSEFKQGLNLSWDIIDNEDFVLRFDLLNDSETKNKQHLNFGAAFTENYEIDQIFTDAIFAFSRKLNLI